MFKDDLSFYEENGFGTLASKQAKILSIGCKILYKRASQEEACQLILHALGIAVDRNKRNYGYVNAILKSWEQQNYLSVHEVLVNDKTSVGACAANDRRISRVRF